MVGGFLCKIAREASHAPPPLLPLKMSFDQANEAVIVQNLIEQKSYFSPEEELAGAGFPCFLFY